MRARLLIKLWIPVCCAMVMTSIVLPAARTVARLRQAAPNWGRLANPGFVNQRIKATLFFAGQALDGTNKYACPSGNNLDKYTLHPLDDNHLKWSENAANKDLALNQMAQAGINVINMSSWGEDFLPCAWVTGAAPMQTSPLSHNELFIAAVGKPLLIMPFLETRGGDFPYRFRREFPRRPDGQLAPGTISQIVNLINRYLKNPSHPEWAEKWARVYDLKGEERYAITIIHAASEHLDSDDDAAFAAGFDTVANEVFQQTGGEKNGGVKVGFFIDALPSEAGDSFGDFRPSPEKTGPYLRNTASLLGIECFVPEIFLGSSDTAEVINWKRDFSRRWFQTGIPFLMDVSPGYDGHLVFPKSVRYGFSLTWLCQVAQMTKDYGQAGMVFNAWNGYTEGIVAVPTQEYGSLFYDWLRSLQYADVYARKPDAAAPRNGTWACPYTLAEAIERVPVGGTIGLLPTTSEPFDAPPTPIKKACKIIAFGGSATIGR